MNEMNNKNYGFWRPDEPGAGRNDQKTLNENQSGIHPGSPVYSEDFTAK